MSEIKKYGPDKRDSNLKREDKKKLETNTGVASSHNSDLFGGKKLTDKAMGPDVKVKRKLPLMNFSKALCQTSALRKKSALPLFPKTK